MQQPRGAVRHVLYIRRPMMPYTRGLLASVPKIVFGAQKRPLQAIPGNVPDPRHLPPGCTFGSRCDYFRAGQCDVAVPELRSVEAGHDARCHRLEEIPSGALR